MKIATIFGTRPEIIRLSRIIERLDRSSDHVIVHTGQNHDPNLSDIFFRELRIRQPDRHLGVQSSSFAEQAAEIISRSAKALAEIRPDRLLILGDTNSGLSSVVAARMRIPVFHMEAGNRAYDNRIPEEINRRLIDHCSDVLLPYTHRSKENLLREGIERRRIFVTGNPIHEVLQHYRKDIDASTILSELGVTDHEYFLVTLHRAENVDDPLRLESFLHGLALVANHFAKPMVVSVHPRTADALRRYELSPSSDRLRLLKPLGFFNFCRLEKTAFCVLSDSGTVQEECCLFQIPNVTLRDVTERPETIECGSNILSGAHPDFILEAVKIAVDRNPWEIPAEYLAENVSQTVNKILLGYIDRNEC